MVQFKIFGRGRTIVKYTKETLCFRYLWIHTGCINKFKTQKRKNLRLQLLTKILFYSFVLKRKVLFVTVWVLLNDKRQHSNFLDPPYNNITWTQI